MTAHIRLMGEMLDFIAAVRGMVRQRVQRRSSRGYGDCGDGVRREEHSSWPFTAEGGS